MTPATACMNPSSVSDELIFVAGEDASAASAAGAQFQHFISYPLIEISIAATIMRPPSSSGRGDGPRVDADRERSGHFLIVPRCLKAIR